MRIPYGDAHRALLIDDRAIGTDQKQKYLLTVNQDNVVEYRRVNVGRLLDGLRVIESGLKPDDMVIVKGVQRARPGLQGAAHGRREACRRNTIAWARRSFGRPTTRRRATRSLPAMFSHFFIDRPILASVPSILITLVGLVAVFLLPVAQYPEITPPTVQVACTYPGASAQVVADTVAAPIEQQVNGVEDMLYMLSQSSNDGTYQPDGHLQGGHRPEHGPGAGAEPRRPGDSRAARRGEADRRDGEEAVARPDVHRESVLARRPLRPALFEQLRPDSASKTRWLVWRAWAT